MVNLGFGLGTILGIGIALAGVGLYFLRTLRPNLARDHDIFFAAVALLCGGILVFQSWRLDPILQFAQFLSIGSAVWFAYEAIRLRGITTEQAKRATPLVDDERPVSRRYRAELDDLTPLDEQRTITRRIQGTRDSRDEEYNDGSRRRAAGSDSGYDDARSRRRASRPLPPDRSDRYRSDVAGEWGDDRSDDVGSSRSGMRESIRDSGISSSSRSSRRSSRPAPSPRRRGGSDSDYVDYKPIDYTDDSPNSPREDDWR
jgi:hypothetical protein